MSEKCQYFFFVNNITLLISTQTGNANIYYKSRAIMFLNTDITTDVHGIYTGGCESLQGGGLLHECEYLVLAKLCS